MKPNQSIRDGIKSFFCQKHEPKQLDIKDIPYIYPPEIYEFERLIYELKWFVKVEEARQRRTPLSPPSKGGDGQGMEVNNLEDVKDAINN